MATDTQAQTPPAPQPVPGEMWIKLALHPEITQEIVNDLMHNIALGLQTVTHLVNNADFTANVGGVIITYSAAILPATMGDIEPTPSWLARGEKTVNV